MWGSNSKGQLALADALPSKQGSNASLPRLVENQLGRGICALELGYDQTFICSAEKGYYTDINSEIFQVWKRKLKKFEEKVQTQAV